MRIEDVKVGMIVRPIHTDAGYARLACKVLSTHTVGSVTPVLCVRPAGSTQTTNYYAWAVEPCDEAVYYGQGGV